VQRLRHIEEFGYSSIFWPDHFTDQWEPVAALAAAAAVTERISVGSLVYDVDYRHPVVLASDYVEAGMPFERPGIRIERLDEALQIIRAMWTRERTRFEGRHYTIRDVARAADLPDGSRPRILVGGGGPKLLALAGRHADIVGINPRMDRGRVTRKTARDCAPERIRQKVAWVREAASGAGRDPDALELSSLTFVVALTDQPSGVREELARQNRMSVDDVTGCPLFLTGSSAEIRDRLRAQREDTGISYVVVQGRDPELLERFAAEVVTPLAGT
jgi:alkanesulfonate monooxygenase SsuD/methylene tetrahydromethanopterin reductase-like flavin-dependent oxidoreductase (luciferase family)